MIYLYVKTHNITGLKYLGKTKSKNPNTYKGSGKRWSNHIKKHGYNVTTKILFQSENPKEIKQMGLYYSRLWNIVQSKEWANLKEESGDGGWNQELATQGLLNKYGVNRPHLVPGAKEKTQKTIFQKYGVLHNLNIPYIRDKCNAALLEKFGTTNPFNLPEIREKATKNRLITFLHKYGVENPSQIPEVKSKTKQKYIEIGHQQGPKNSQFGTMWITNGTENKKTKKIDNIPEGWYKGRVTK